MYADLTASFKIHESKKLWIDISGTFLISEQSSKLFKLDGI